MWLPRFYIFHPGLYPVSKDSGTVYVITELKLLMSKIQIIIHTFGKSIFSQTKKVCLKKEQMNTGINRFSKTNEKVQHFPEAIMLKVQWPPKELVELCVCICMVQVHLNADLSWNFPLWILPGFPTCENGLILTMYSSV